jgi:hypothetical protein
LLLELLCRFRRRRLRRRRLRGWRHGGEEMNKKSSRAANARSRS